MTPEEECKKTNRRMVLQITTYTPWQCLVLGRWVKAFKFLLPYKAHWDGKSTSDSFTKHPVSRCQTALAYCPQHSWREPSTPRPEVRQWGPGELGWATAAVPGVSRQANTASQFTCAEASASPTPRAADPRGGVPRAPGICLWWERPTLVERALSGIQYHTDHSFLSCLHSSVIQTLHKKQWHHSCGGARGCWIDMWPSLPENNLRVAAKR